MKLALGISLMVSAEGIMMGGGVAMWTGEDGMMVVTLGEHIVSLLASLARCNAMTGVIVRRAFGVLVLRRVKLYQGFSSVMHKYQVELRSRLM